MEVDTYLVRPSVADSAIRTLVALVPVAALTAISNHLDRRGLWLALPWAALALVAVSLAVLNHQFTVGVSGISGSAPITALLGAVQVGAAFAVLLTTIVLALVGRGKV